MKKTILGTVILASSVLLVACSSSNSDKKESSNKPETVKTHKQEKYYFKNNVAKLQDEKIEITQTKVINPGEKGNEYSDKPVIAFWYKVTNLSDKKIDPSSAWMAVFEAYQDNNKNRENKLEVGSLPDDKFMNTQTDNIKKNGTVENAVSYELSDTNTPVTLKATKGFDGTSLGQKVYKLK